MALQGTIDAFPLTDVLQLLATSAKSGKLTLDGDRGRTEVWIERGEVVGTDSGTAATAEHLVFELLRFGDGSFAFGDDSGRPVRSIDPVPLTSCLARAESLLEEWKRIEALVPSPAHRVALASELVEQSVTLDQSDWTVLVAVGDGPSVDTVGRRLGSDEFSCGALLAALVERGVLVVEEPDPAGGASLSEPGRDRVEPVDLVDLASLRGDGLGEDPTGSDGFPDRFPIDDLLGGSDSDSEAWADDEDGRFAAAQTLEPAASDPFAPFGGDLNERTAEAWDDVVSGHVTDPADMRFEGDPDSVAGDGADEVLRQMSRLSPKAAEAIAAALNTSGPADSTMYETAADESVGDGPEPFLGTL